MIKGRLSALYKIKPLFLWVLNESGKLKLLILANATGSIEHSLGVYLNSNTAQLQTHDAYWRSPKKIRNLYSSYPQSMVLVEGDLHLGTQGLPDGGGDFAGTFQPATHWGGRIFKYGSGTFTMSGNSTDSYLEFFLRAAR